MNMRHLWCAAALAASCGAHATTIEATFDVTGVSYRTGTGIDIVWSEVPAQPSFSLSVRFDLESPHVLKNEGEVAGYDIFATAGFRNPQVGQSPYSAELEERTPLDVPWSVGTMYTQIVFVGSQPGSQEWLDVQVGGTDEGLVGSENDAHGYYRLLSLYKPAGFVSFADFSTDHGAAALNLLHGLVGQTFGAGYNENFWHRTASSMDAVSISGDLTLRSVSVVPEPATALLMALGLLATVSLNRRTAEPSAPARLT